MTDTMVELPADHTEADPRTVYRATVTTGWRRTFPPSIQETLRAAGSVDPGNYLPVENLLVAVIRDPGPEGPYWALLTPGTAYREGNENWGLVHPDVRDRYRTTHRIWQLAARPAVTITGIEPAPQESEEAPTLPSTVAEADPHTVYTATVCNSNYGNFPRYWQQSRGPITNQMLADGTHADLWTIVDQLVVPNLDRTNWYWLVEGTDDAYGDDDWSAVAPEIMDRYRATHRLWRTRAMTDARERFNLVIVTGISEVVHTTETIAEAQPEITLETADQTQVYRGTVRSHSSESFPAVLRDRARSNIIDGYFTVDNLMLARNLPGSSWSILSEVQEGNDQFRFGTVNWYYLDPSMRDRFGNTHRIWSANLGAEVTIQGVWEAPTEEAPVLEAVAEPALFVAPTWETADPETIYRAQVRTTDQRTFPPSITQHQNRWNGHWTEEVLVIRRRATEAYYDGRERRPANPWVIITPDTSINRRTDNGGWISSYVSDAASRLYRHSYKLWVAAYNPQVTILGVEVPGPALRQQTPTGIVPVAAQTPLPTRPQDADPDTVYIARVTGGMPHARPADNVMVVQDARYDHLYWVALLDRALGNEMINGHVSQAVFDRFNGTHSQWFIESSNVTITGIHTPTPQPRPERRRPERPLPTNWAEAEEGVLYRGEMTNWSFGPSHYVHRPEARAEIIWVKSRNNFRWWLGLYPSAAGGGEEFAADNRYLPREVAERFHATHRMWAINANQLTITGFHDGAVPPPPPPPAPGTNRLGEIIPTDPDEWRRFLLSKLDAKRDRHSWCDDYERYVIEPLDLRTPIGTRDFDVTVTAQVEQTVRVRANSVDSARAQARRDVVPTMRINLFGTLTPTTAGPAPVIVLRSIGVQA
jgi:hypothetical protein